MSTEVVLAFNRLVGRLWERLLQALLVMWVTQSLMRLLTRRVLESQARVQPAVRALHVEPSIASGICGLGVRSDG